MNKSTIISIIVVVLVVAGVVYYAAKKDNAPSVYNDFAACIANTGTKFYGAFWCPHCQEQKKMFGTSAKLLPYVECSTPDGQGQLEVCIDEEIKGYPTWKFPNGQIESNVLSLDQLSSITGCALPLN